MGWGLFPSIAWQFKNTQARGCPAAGLKGVPMSHEDLVELTLGPRINPVGLLMRKPRIISFALRRTITQEPV